MTITPDEVVAPAVFRTDASTNRSNRAFACANRAGSGPWWSNRRPSLIRSFHGFAIVSGIMLLLVALGASAASDEQSYPRKLIRLVVPFAPGGGADIMGRALGQKLSASLRQPVVIDNRPGGGGRMGPEFVAKSAPDGYTLLLGTSSALVFLPALDEKLAYDPIRDFSHIAPFASAASVLLVHPSVPATSVRELITLAKSRPAQLNYASTGIGTPGHLAAELFNYAGRIKTMQIPYQGAGPGIIATMSGETDFIFSNILPAISPIKSGRLRPLAVTSLQRSSVLPALPTVAESGIPGFDVSIFFGLVSPARTPREIISTLYMETSKAGQSTDLRERLARGGAEPMSVRAPEEFTKIISVELEKWSKIIKHANIRRE